MLRWSAHTPRRLLIEYIGKIRYALAAYCPAKPGGDGIQPAGDRPLAEASPPRDGAIFIRQRPLIIIDVGWGRLTMILEEASVPVHAAFSRGLAAGIIL